MENDFLRSVSKACGIESRKTQVDEKHPRLSVNRQLQLLKVPRLTAELKRRGFNINHKRVRRLQKALGLRTIYPRPHFNTSEPHPEHKKFPYLLKGLEIDHPNQVWSTDITYTAVNGHRAFVIGIVNWFSRKLMAYNVVIYIPIITCEIIVFV